MKRNAWLSSLIALTLSIACALGWSKSEAADAKSNANSSGNSKSVQRSATPSADIAGKYIVAGTNEDGSPYRGELEVIRHGDVYQFRWNAGQQYDGIGIRNGNVVAVAFTQGAKGKGCAVVSYQILADGTLDGAWGYWGVNERGTERAQPTSGSDVAGDYNITGKNPNGSSYRGTLAVAAKAGGYSFVWSNNASGFGIKQGDTLSVGIGGSRCAFVAYRIKSDGTLDAVWGGFGSSKTGTEKATKK